MKKYWGASACGGPGCCGARASALGLAGARLLAHPLRIPGAVYVLGHFLSNLAS